MPQDFHPGTTDGFVIVDIVRENIVRETRLMTDESPYVLAKEFASHETVRPGAGEYVRGRCASRHSTAVSRE